MTKCTPGERILMKYGPCWVEGENYIGLRNDIDRAIRRAQEKAWDECHLWLNDNPDATNAAMDKANPYRGRKR